MSSKRHNELFDEIATDIRILADVISDFELCTKAINEFHKSSYQLRKFDNKKALLSIELGGIDLRIHEKQRTKPAIEYLDDRLHVDISLKLDVDLASKGRILDSIVGNSVKFTIIGFANHGDRVDEIVSAWHFDHHQYQSNANTACHPTFHWQHGGRELKSVSDDIEGILLMETPRLFAPPLDAVLTVDFLLSHFNGPKWQKMRNEDRRYSKIVKRSQARFWRPYFDEIADHLHSEQPSSSDYSGEFLPNIL